MSVIILQGDARNLPLPDESVDLLVTSPPYWQLRSYSDNGEHYEGQIGSESTPAEYLENLLECTREWMRVLKSTGSMFINCGDKYANDTKWDVARKRPSGKQEKTEIVRKKLSTGIPAKSLAGLPWRYAISCIDDLGLILRAEIIWSKVNGLPESVTDRVRRSHEQVFHFTKQQKYFTSVDEIREPSGASSSRKTVAPNKGMIHGPGVNGQQLTEGGLSAALTGQGFIPNQHNPLGKLPGSVWSIPSSPLKVPDWVGIDHFAAYPPELCRRIILGWSPREICGKCNEGRQPVTESSANGRPRHDTGDGGRGTRGLPGYGDINRSSWSEGVTRTILGYACACTPYIDHPGTGERYGGVKHSGGAQGINKDSVKYHIGDHVSGGTAQRTGPWREYLLEDWTAPDSHPAVILDPFGGTGTTAMVADVLGRTGISVDRSADYCKLAQWRVHDPVQRAKVLREKVKPSKKIDQPSLFGEWDAT